ncbi:hypothetical protein CN527_30835 [Bacillus cereus]|nr:hypothetical protein CN527_30835 [Bacillus cereus]
MNLNMNIDLNINQNYQEEFCCNVCGEAMHEGYVVYNGHYYEYYDFKKCLHSVYTPKEYKQMQEEDRAYKTQYI